MCMKRKYKKMEEGWRHETRQGGYSERMSVDFEQTNKLCKEALVFSRHFRIVIDVLYVWFGLVGFGLHCFPLFIGNINVGCKKSKW